MSHTVSGCRTWKNMYKKDAGSRKIHQTASNLQPFDLHSNAYRSQPGDQNVFSLLFSRTCINRNPGQQPLLSLSTLMDIILFIRLYSSRAEGHYISMDPKFKTRRKKLNQYNFLLDRNPHIPHQKKEQHQGKKFYLNLLKSQEAFSLHFESIAQYYKYGSAMQLSLCIKFCQHSIYNDYDNSES